jgi:hypothetical protein
VSEDKQEPDRAEKSKVDGETTAALLAKKAGEALIPVFITAGSLLGFVAFAGAVVLWTRLSAVGIPPEQALDVAPEGELVAIGAEFLLVFGLLGALALAAVLLVDRAARPTPGMARALLVLLAVEGIIAIALVEGRSAWQTVVDAELFVLPIALLVWATTLDAFGRLKDDLDRRPDETTPLCRYGILRLHDPASRSKGQWWAVVYGPICLVTAAVLAAMAMLLMGTGNSVFGLVFSGFATAFVVWAVVLVLRDLKVVRQGRSRESEAEARQPEKQEQKKRDAGGFKGWLCRIPEAFRCEQEDEREQEQAEEEAERKRLQHPGPLRLVLTWEGVALALVSMAVAIGLVLWRLGLEEWWAAATLAVAAVVVGALWRMAAFTHKRVAWFAVGVFLSAPLVGVIAETVKNLDHPRVQAVALIRKGDGPTESIQGLYVTETSSRVYFANLATEGCSKTTESGSARLFWIPKKDVLAMSIGPLQDVEQAGKSALEMSYTLTPAIETPEASVELGFGKKQEEEERESVKWHDTRLANAGLAVRPNFGTGLSLTPPVASPGKAVTLRMSEENTGVDGFGTARAAHNVRIGGEIADIAKERASGAAEAEYIEVANGRLVKLGKEGAYLKNEAGEYEEVGEGRDGAYVRLDDPAILTVDGKPFTGEEPVYVRVAGPTVVRRAQKVKLAGGVFEGRRQPPETVRLGGKRLLRQAWSPNRIKFIVPEDAKTGVVTVQCAQLADAQLLTVTRKPTARISVQMQQGSGRVTFNSAGSEGGDSKIVSQSWKIGGLRRSRHRKVSIRMPARRGIYSVRLVVTDEDGNTGVARLRLLRLPTPLFAFDKSWPRPERLVEDDARSLLSAVGKDPPVAIELDGHADDPGTFAFNLNLSLERDEHVRKELLGPLSSAEAEQSATQGRPTVTVEEKAYGERCPIDHRSGRRRRNRRVDVFILDRGVTVKPPVGCHPERVKTLAWQLPPES